MKAEIVIVGGGVAGLAAAWALARRGARSVTLIEQDSMLCSHASGHNAAIFRPLEADPELCRLAQRSAELFPTLAAGVSLLERSGLLLLHSDSRGLVATSTVAARAGVVHELLTPERVAERLPGLSNQAGCHGLYSPEGGVIDIHALAEALASACRRLGVQIQSGIRVTGVLSTAARVTGVSTLEQGHIEAERVVLAVGAWSPELSRQVGPGLELVPVRRHLVLLEPVQPLPEGLPVVWRLDDEVYFRREGGRVLASPCDETSSSAGAVQPDFDALGPLARKLRAFGPLLAAAGVARYWACLRTFAPDRRPVIGADGRLSGLYWLAGLGGFGMSTGVAAGELLAEALLEGRSAPAFAPARLLSRSPRPDVK